MDKHALRFLLRAAALGATAALAATLVPALAQNNRPSLAGFQRQDAIVKAHKSALGRVNMTLALAASAALAAPATADEILPERTFPAGSASTSTKTEAPALVLGGTFVILATVNETFPAALRVDSGATDVMLPRTVAARLISAGSLTHADYLTTKTYRLADGSLRTQKVYRPRSLTVGTFIVHDTACTISNDDTGLLGQSFLSKAQDWAMDCRGRGGGRYQPVVCRRSGAVHACPPVRGTASGPHSNR